MHHGSISATSEGTNKGTRLIVRLPTVEAPARSRQLAGRPTDKKSSLSDRRLRILLVEDHPDTAEQLKRLLKRAGHEVSCAGSLREAREFVESAERQSTHAHFDMLISDLGLPDGSGHELMRDLQRGHHIPGIALSGYGMNEDIRNSMAAGFSRHITKPVDWQELKSAIEKIAGDGESQTDGA